MKHDHRFEAKAEHTGEAREPDRWKLLALITETRRPLGLGQRDINVLRALYSFVPKGEIIGVEKVVFPSNHRLAERAGGLSERTLRRAISRLVEMGLIARRDSATRKRFSIRRRTGEIVTAFGFDIAPAFLRIRELLGIASALSDDAAQQAKLREEIRILRGAIDLPEQTSIELDRTLRRRLTVASLKDICADLKTQAQSTKVTANNSQSDRLVNNDPHKPQKEDDRDQINNYDLPIVASFFPDLKCRSSDNRSIAQSMGGILGLPESLVRRASDLHGPSNVLHILDRMAEKIETIRDPSHHFQVLVEA